MTLTQSRRARKDPRWLMLAIVLAAFALRVVALGAKSLWIDEADSVYFAQHAWGDLIWRLCDPHPPGYYALLKGAMALGGTSEFVVRLPSALAGTLAVALVGRLTQTTNKLVTTNTANNRTSTRWLAAGLLAVAPLDVWYAQEARMYALVTLLGLGAACCAAAWVRRRSWVAAAGYAALAMAGALADQAAAAPLGLIGLAAAVAIVYQKSGRVTSIRRLGVWLGLQIAPIGAFLLWYRRADYAAQINTNTFYPLTMLRMVAERWGGWRGWTLGLGLAAGIGVSAAVLVAVSGQRSAVSAKRRATAAAWAVLAVFAGGTVFSVVPRLYTVKRLGVSLLPYGLMLAAWALRWVTRRGGRRLAVGLALGGSLALSLVNVWAIPKTPWQEVVATVSAAVTPGDAVWVDELAVPAFDYYNERGVERRVLAAREMDALAEAGLPANRLWLIVQAGRYRNPLDFLSGLATVTPVWSDTWHTVDARAYDAAELTAADLRAEVPAWALGWPSPLDSACAASPW